jgi:hypothetical protein
VWSPELSIFVAVAVSGSNRVMTSSDGITWTIITSPTNNWRGVTWSAELSVFVAVANSGTGTRVMTSNFGLPAKNNTLMAYISATEGNVNLNGTLVSNATVPSMVSTNFTSSNLLVTNDGVNASFNSNRIGVISDYFRYSLRIDGTREDQVNALAIDSTDALYVGGYSTSTRANFYAADGTTVMSTMGNSNISDNVGFVAKYSSTGSLLHTLRIDGTGNEIVNALTVDSTNALYVGGYYTSTLVNFYATNGTTIVSTISNSSINYASYIVKYSSSGSLLHTLKIDGTGGNIMQSLEVDSTNALYVGGYVNSSGTQANFYATDGTTIVSTMGNLSTNLVGFVAKYGSTGSLLHTLRIDGTGSDQVNALAIDSTNALYVGGVINNNGTQANFYATDGTTVVSTMGRLATVSYVGFVAKYSSSGSLLHTLRIDGTGSDFVQSLAVDSNNALYIAGSSASTRANFYATDGATIVSTIDAFNINSVGFVAKYDSTGSLLYTLRIEGFGFETAQTLDIDSTNALYVGGFYTSTQANFYATNGTTVVSTMGNLNTSSASYFVKYSSSGSLLNTPIRIDGIRAEEIKSLKLDSNDAVYVGGYYFSTQANFYTTNGTTIVSTMGNLTTNGTLQAGFVAKYQLPQFTGINTTGGNVGINTTTPSSTLQINGSLAKSSGTFDILHPIYDDRRLIHSFIEGPRCDLIYRGQVTLNNGTATVNVDTDCVAEDDCVMTEGTFTALTTNVDVFLTNKTGFSELTYTLFGNILTITSEENVNDTVSWMIVAERKDDTIKKWNRTNQNGFLITEY